MTIDPCVVLSLWKTLLTNFGTVELPTWHRFSIGLVNVKKAKLGQKGPWRPLDCNMESLAKTSPPPLVNSLEFGCFYKVSCNWPFGLKRNSFTFNDNIRIWQQMCNKWYGKVSLTTSELHGTLPAKKLTKHLTMMTCLGNLIKIGKGMRSSTIEMILEPCIGTQKCLM